MTVDWSQWMTATPDQQQEMLRRYRDTVKAESEQARRAYSKEVARRAAKR